MKILISDKISQGCIDILTKEGFIVDYKPGTPHDELKKIIGQYDALIVRSATKVTKDLIEAGKNLKVIGRPGAGVDNIDVETATKRGIPVMNTPGGNAVAVAEHTISLMLALSRNIPQAVFSMKSGKWERSAFMGNELAGKILGVIGLGRIGREVAHRAKAFDMQIIGYDPLISKEFSAKMQIELVTLEELYKNSDFITIHVPLTDETKNLIGKKHFEMCKKGAKIINCSRGGIIDEKALYNAIQSGHIGGAALDVFEEEPLKDFSLVNVPNVIATPHLGASTEEAQEKVALEIAQQVADALKERGIKFAVNVVTVAPELVTFVRPYMKLGEKLGKLQAQIAEGTVQEINVEYAGEMLKYPVEPITSGIVKGIVKELVEEHVNEISAMAIAKERGLRILETKAPDSGGFTSLITVRLKTTEGESAISGTIFGKEKARMVHWNEFYIDSDLDGTFLVFSNMDKPGVVGKLGTILGKHNVNIAGISLGRSGPGGRALTMMNIDNIPSQEAIKEISELPEMFYVKIVNL